MGVLALELSAGSTPTHAALPPEQAGELRSLQLRLQFGVVGHQFLDTLGVLPHEVHNGQLDSLALQHEVRRDWIFPNLPPAWVHHVRFATIAMPQPIPAT